MSFASFIKGVAEAYNASISSVPEGYITIINLLIFTIVIVIYSVFVWKFYRFIAKKDIIDLKLSQYNKTQKPFLNKLVAMAFFFLEYIIIVPFLVVFWFAIFACFLLLLSKSPTSQVLLITAAVIASIRVIAYYKTELAKELAKIIAFTVLVIFLISPDFFVLSKLINQVKEIPSLFSHIVYYLIFLVALEIFLRFVDLLFLSMHIVKEENTETQKK